MTSFQVVAAHVDRGKELYLFGRDANGGSVAVALQDVRPYLWVAAPPAGEAAAFVAQVNSRLASAAPAGQSSSSWGAKPAAAAVQAGETREFLRFTGGYDPKPRPFLKLVMQSARDAYAVRDACGAAELAEADIDFAAQACADLGIAPGAWAELGPAAQPAKMPGVRADACFRAPASALVARPDLTGNAPLRVLAFDIETLTRDLGNGAVKFYAGDDPEARCVCIAACDVAVGRPGSGRRTVFALDPDAKEPRVATEGEVEIRYLLDEAALLRAFAAHVRDRDPDFLSGWNTDSFDLEWLAAAAARVGAEPDLWAGLSRFDRDPARHRAAKPGLKVRLSAPGRVPYDLMQWFKKNRNLEQYGLNFVAGLFNCGAKDDVSYSDIGRLFQTEEGRRKLALYCEQDTSLVLRLLAAPELDPLGKDMALCAITGVFPADLLGRGTQHTLRCKVLRVAHARGFVLPYVPRDARDKTDKPESEEEDAVGFQGGKVLTAKSGRYTDPVVVFDFASLYPSCMEEMGTCPSARLTRARAMELGVAVLTPPAPSLDGRWLRPDCAELVVTDDWRTGAICIEGRTFRYETDLNDAIVDGAGARAELFDRGYGLRWRDGTEWRRRPDEVLCFTAREVFVGVVPQMEKDLKVERKEAKKRMAAAEAAGDAAAAAFFNNVQNSVKVLMNGLYGGFGTARGGIFPDGQAIAAAITATGRGWLCAVKKRVEQLAYVAPGGAWGIGEADRPAGAVGVKIVYGDTDSVFCHLPGLSLQQAAAFGEAVSAHFAERVLPYPQKLEFEKVLMPFLLYRKKMYTGIKYEKYGEGAKGKMLSKGIALVRRDNSKLVRAAMKETLECALRADALASDAVAVAARHIALMEASVRSMHEAVRPADHLPIEAFVLSAGISKDLGSYAGPANSAAMVARRLMEINPLEKIGSGARVTFVIAASSSGARRAEQAELVSDLLRERKPLDACYYADAIRAKCEPLLSAMFVREETARATVRSATGELVVVAPKRQSDRSKLPGEMEAARRLAEAAEAARRARAASEPRAEKRKVNAFDMMRAGAAAASKKRK